ncbi:DNA polymerase III subunit gamma/tau [Amphritea sp. HPY]|uniref:DNA polymerase III subunit gamma/tau n=1 Tax=Amphritea sp. HPY TaxID=3421652 RepID=UPI003D7F093F
MSYQVLARKWRPARFQEMVGQEHVLKALVNALDDDRLHHAYLFTGTRGVGKTSIARLFAKSLNCETGVSSTPCGECSACREISEGRFVDLIEVDAASRTKVEDTRELLENVQYAPTHGRFKVYLIDEVHMLSTHSFNALLKTLEEPPPHVKFLLATTDPQKLPVTILSRCLQFNLKNMIPERIVDHLSHVLAAENISFEEPALWLLARSADGSMRDALSLTDQAIAFGAGEINEADVRAMLGTIDSRLVYRLVECLSQHDARTLLSAVEDLSRFSPDYNTVLGDMISLLHRIALAQVVPDAIDNGMGDREQVLQLAGSLRAEDVQLFYQTALVGRKDLPFVPDSREGLEMVLLRMLAFRPASVSSAPLTPLPEATTATVSHVVTQEPGAKPDGQAAPESKSGPQLESQLAGQSLQRPEVAQAEVPQPKVSQETQLEPEPERTPEALVEAVDETVVETVIGNQAEPVAAAISPALDSTVSQAEVVSPSSPAPAQVLSDDQSPPWQTDTAPVAGSSQVVEPVRAVENTVSENGVSDTLVTQTTVTQTASPQTIASASPQSSVATSPQMMSEMSEIQSAPQDYDDSYTQTESYPQEYAPVKKSETTDTPPWEVADTAVVPESQTVVTQSVVPSVTSRPVTEQPVEQVIVDLGAQAKVSNPAEVLSTDLGALEADQWVLLVDLIGITGMTYSIAANTSLESVSNGMLQFHYAPEQKALISEVHIERIRDAVAQYFDCGVEVEFNLGSFSRETPSQYRTRKRAERQVEAISSLEQDPVVQTLIERFDGQLDIASVEPID